MTPEQIKAARALVDRLDGYTPGPWTVERFGSYRNNDGTMFETWKISPQRSVYGSMFENDARLAAVAPDLHATLTAALDEIERLQGEMSERGVYSGPMIDALLSECKTLRTEKHADAEAIRALRDEVERLRKPNPMGSVIPTASSPMTAPPNKPKR